MQRNAVIEMIPLAGGNMKGRRGRYDSSILDPSVWAADVLAWNLIHEFITMIFLYCFPCRRIDTENSGLSLQSVSHEGRVSPLTKQLHLKFPARYICQNQLVNSWTWSITPKLVTQCKWIKYSNYSQHLHVFPSNIYKWVLVYLKIQSLLKNIK